MLYRLLEQIWQDAAGEAECVSGLFGTLGSVWSKCALAADERLYV